MKNIKMFVLILGMELLVMGCTVDTTPTAVSAETQISVDTATVVPFSTSTPQATVTPRPTYTSTPLPEWVVNFTEPILKVIAERPPTYEDDFNNPPSGWTVGEVANTNGTGELGYLDGQYFARANPSDAKEYSCVTGQTNRLESLSDFVVEYDAKFVLGGSGNYSFQYGVYALGGNYQDGIYFVKCNRDSCPGFAEHRDSSLSLDTAWKHFQLFVRGPRLAVYLDGLPVLYAEDQNYSKKDSQGFFSFTLCDFGNTPMESNWDNLKIWDISDLP